MNAINRLRAAIARKTDLDPFALTDQVVANMFDDKLDIVGDILKHRDNPKLVGQILIDLLDSAIEDIVNDAEAEAMDSAAELRAAHDRVEALGYNKVNML